MPFDLTVAAFQPSTGTTPRQRIDGKGTHRRCANHLTVSACNWMIPVDRKDTYCLSCRLNHIIPDLSIPRNQLAWLKLETAKRRLLYSLLLLGLPITSKQENPSGGLAFDFLDNSAAEVPVFTGHMDGLITINLDETDDPKREQARQMMGEMYRTVLGHFRHEVGHYFWEMLVLNTNRIEEFRVIFGDERLDYATALGNHYATGPRIDWQLKHVSAYAAAHPWEDWAETWAHYLHIIDTLETAASEGLVIRHGQNETIIRPPLDQSFAAIASQWRDVRLLLNGLNRSMGMPDPYPFFLAEAVIKKLTVIHDWVAEKNAVA